MPAPPSAEAGKGRTKPRTIIVIKDSDEEDGGGQAGRELGSGVATAAAAAGQALKLVKPEPVDDAGFHPVGPAALRLGVVPISPWAQNPRAPSSPPAQNPRALSPSSPRAPSPRAPSPPRAPGPRAPSSPPTQNPGAPSSPRAPSSRAPSSPRAPSPRAPSPPSPVAAAGQHQPEIIAISDDHDDEDGSRFRGAVPLAMIDGSGRRLVRRVKEEEASDDLDCDWVRSAEAKRALVAVAAPGSPHVKKKRKRKRATPDGAKPDARGGVHAFDRNSSASGARRRATSMADDARSSRDVKSREGSRGAMGDRSGSSKKALVSSEESRGARGKARSGGGSRKGRSTSVAPANWMGTSIGSRIRSRSRKQGTVEYSARVSSEDAGEDEVQEQKQKRVEDVESMEVDDNDDDGAQPDARGGSGGVHAFDRNSSASGAGRRSTSMADDARNSRDVKRREESRGAVGDRPGSSKKALVSSEESRGARGKARSGGGSRRERSTNVAPANWIGTSIGSRIRSRSRKQGTVEYSARVSSEDTGEDEVQEQKQKRVEDVQSMEVDDDDDDDDDNGAGNGLDQESEQNEAKGVEDVESMEADDDDDDDDNNNNNSNGAGNGVHQQSEQDEALEGRSRQDSHGIDNEEEEGDDQEESHSIYDGEGEQEEDASDGVEQEVDETGEEDEQELDETEKAQPVTPASTTIAGSSFRSGGDDTRIFRKRVFEGIYLLQKPRKTVGKGIGARTRSHRKCKDKKLLRRGTFSKPYNIDISDSSSDSEEDIVPPAPPQALLSSSEEDNIIFGKRKRRRAVNKRQRKRSSTSSDEEYRAYARDAKERPFRRLKKGLSNLQAGKEGCRKYDGSNPGHAKYNGPNGENEQDCIFFKRKAHKIRIKKRGPAAKAAYDELLNSLFSVWENHINDPDDEAAGNSLPLVFSFGDEDAEGIIQNNKYQEDLWRECDIAFESMNIGNGSEEDGLEIPPVEVTSCKNGQHEFIIDEQIGVRCKHCNVVDIEIRDILPTVGKFSAERESAIDPVLEKMLKEMLNVFEQNDVLVSNGHELPCNFGGHKVGSVWDLIPGVKETMFPHQQDAFEFLWTKLAGGTTIEQLKQTVKTDFGGGCVISHAPGTGKTRLAITFVQSYLEVFPNCSPVIIAPRGMLATWEKEFRKWKVKLPFHVLNSTEINWSEDKTIQEQVAKNGTFHRRLLTDKMDQNYRRLVKLGSWMNGTSIIGLSYSLFRKLANHEGMDGDKVRKLLLEKPDLLVLDEGHTPRNKKSLIWKVLKRVRTEKRIILSGTLFQNNFEELYNTLRLVRPKDEGKDLWSSLRLSDITEENINEVRKKLDPIVHIHSGKFLQKSLPGLRESVVILNPVPYQKEVIAVMEETLAFKKTVEKTVAKTMGLDAEYKISIASIHPSLLASAKLSVKEKSILDKPKLESLRSNPSEGVKTRFVLEIVRLCDALNERVLVFSQYLEPLNLIMEQLKAGFNWAADKEILLMTGSVHVKNRQTMVEVFNDMKSKAKVMLASTKACCEGITLIGASRVVLLDVVWNPSVGRQAIGRAYRFGQEKIVYTYNLIAEGTTEKSKYDRQAKKEHMNKLLFSREPEHGECNLPEELTFNDRVLEEMTAREDLKQLFVKIYVDNEIDGEMEENNTCPQT